VQERLGWRPFDTTAIVFALYVFFLSARSSLPISEKAVSVPHFSVFLFMIGTVNLSSVYKINNFCN
jgi:hypothetical protein